MKNKILNPHLIMVVASVLAFGGTVLSVSENPDKPDPITGTWNCIVPPGGGLPQVNVIKNIHAGGTMIEIDNAAPPSQESPSVGNWIRTGSRSYEATLEQLSFDAAGSFAGTFHYTNPLTLARSNNNMEGTFQFTFVDPSGNVLASGEGTVSCTRLGSN